MGTTGLFGILIRMDPGRFRAVRWPLLWTGAIVIAIVVRIVDVWPELPATMGSHFAAGGQPNAFMSRGGFFLFISLVCGGTIAMMFIIPSG